MLIDCPGCARSYHVSGADLGRRGRAVICAHCDASWYQDAGGTIGVPLRQHGRSRAPDRHRSHGLDERPVAAPPPLAAVGSWLKVACSFAAAITIAATLLERRVVVAHLPRAAALYASVGLPVNVTGLAFAKVRPDRLPSSDVAIRGTLRNTVGYRVAIPRLAFEVRDAAGATLVTWSESVPAHTLAAGRLIDFTSGAHHLPAESRSVLVRLD